MRMLRAIVWLVAMPLCCAVCAADEPASLDDLARYAAAVQHAAGEKSDLAVALVRDVRDPVIAEAGAVLVGEMLLGQGRYAEASQHFQASLEDERHLGLYRGDLLVGADLAVYLDEAEPAEGRVASMLDLLGQADEWAAAMADPVKLDALRERAAAEAIPAALAATPLHAAPHAVPSGVLAHPLNAEWVVPRLNRRVEVLRLFTASQSGKPPTMPRQRAEELGLIAAWLDARDGAFLIDREAWAHLDDAKHRPLRLGLFLLMADRADAAAGMFDRALRTADGGGVDSTPWAVAVLGSGACAVRLGETKRGVALLERFNTEFRQTGMAPVARFVLANHWAGDQVTRANAQRLYADIAEQHAASPYADLALLAMAVAGANHSDGPMLSDARGLLHRRCPASLPDRLAQSLQPIGTVDAEADPPPAPRRRPGDPEPIDVIVHRATLLLPSNPAEDRAIDPWADRAMGKPTRALIRCHLRFGARSGAYRVDGLAARVSPLEPRPPRGSDGRVDFYRLPIFLNPPPKQGGSS